MRSLVLLTVLALALSVALVFGTAIYSPRVHSRAEPHACSNGPAIEVAIGWSLDLANKRSPALAMTETPGFNAGLSAYIDKPSSLKYLGKTGFVVSCPLMISVMPKAGKVGAVEVDMVTSDPYNLDSSMNLMAHWRDKFVSMNLSAAPQRFSRNVEPFDSVAPFFRQFLNLSPIGKSTGAWENNNEIIALGIERWNTAPMNQPIKFMYVVEISVQEQDLFPELH